LDKTISLHLNKGRKVRGTLRGYDQFMNIVLGDAVEEVPGAEQNRIGMVVSFLNPLSAKPRRIVELQ
jgi:small nuclear ribonucleoprotein G